MKTETTKDVNLIDVIAAFIRHRKAGIIIFAVLIILSTVLVYVIPVNSINKLWNKKTYTVRLTIPVVQFPNDIQRYFSFKSEEVLLNDMGSVKFIAEAYKQVATEAQKEDQDLLITYIENSVLNNSLTYSFDKNAKMFTIQYKSQNKQMAEEFIKIISFNLHREFRENYENSIPEAIQEIDLLTNTVSQDLEIKIINAVKNNIDANGLDVDQVIRNLDLNHRSLAGFSNIIAIKNYLLSFSEQENFPWSKELPVVIKVKNARFDQKTIYLIFILLSLFITIVAILMMEYVHNVKDDPSEMEKIRSALKRK